MTQTIDFNVIRATLQQTADHYQLAEKANRACRHWLSKQDCGLPGEWIEAIEARFHSHKFCFAHATLPHPFIETRLDLFWHRKEIGHYRLISSLDGEPEDDYLVIYDEFKKM